MNSAVNTHIFCGQIRQLLKFCHFLTCTFVCVNKVFFSAMKVLKVHDLSPVNALACVSREQGHSLTR